MTSALAKGHGKQRFHMGYDIAAMVREYGTLRDVLFQAMDERGLTPTLRELRVLSKYLHSAIADAASQYALEREEELQKQAAQHMSFLAHELRNPLASARLALASLERKGLLPNARPAGVLTRSLERVDTLISNALMELRLRALPAPLREPVVLEELLRDLEAEIAIDLETRDMRLNI
jgi:signal transduction histidine kinase